MKSIKMIGLENVVSEQIKKSRLEEIASFRVMRFIIGAMHLSSKYRVKWLVLPAW